ncbi:protein of unknown function DUF2877 [Gottschalkia purinilytica]|uniref:DUF2877 domain-containing protein n=1 Tax=Gottschalkia purinilytica TaxID=1503 RepID=A0A0L0WDR7_GOTPU|nr:DUF2877 domain-containing protein [Gottschalkia purinilytica]KNF09619.1 protein of unknown function DUF2877 [Gottschalkia purinilytica]
MQATYICSQLKDKIEEKGTLNGYISSVYRGIFTVVTEDEDLIYFLGSHKYIAPMSIVINDVSNFQDLNLLYNTKVTFTNKEIVLESAGLSIDLDGAEVWNPRPLLLSSESSERTIMNNLLILEEGIFNYGKHEGIAPLMFSIGDYIDEFKSLSNIKIHNNLYSSFIFNKVMDFLSKIVINDINNISMDTKEIIGFGPGMTPSSDDFLCGFMTTLVYMGIHYNLNMSRIYNLNREIIRDMEFDIEQISHSMLMHSSNGMTQEIIKKIIKDIIYSEDKEELLESIKDVVGFGDISGTDILCGIYIGFRTMVNNNIRKFFT